jgi:tetratricopeptide (TPR) repeat protein
MVEINSSPRRRWRLWATVAVVVIGLGVLAVIVGPRLADRRAANRTQDAAALGQQSETAAREGNYREALAHADRAIEAAPDYAPGYARRARAKYFLGDEEGALADADEAIRRDPGLGLAYAYRAPVVALRAAPAAGVADGDKAVERMPDSAEVLACAALARLPAGDAAGAVRLATRAVELNADDPEAHRARGLALAAQGDAGARAEFDAAVRLSGDRPFYLAARADYLLGRALAQKPDAADRELTQAADDADRALRTDPACAPALVALANVHAHRERRFDVLAACEKAVVANPRCVAAYLRAAEDLSPRDLKHYEMLQAALAQTIDLRELQGGDFAFGALLADFQRLASAGMKQPVILHISFPSFEPEQRATLRDAKVNLNSLMDVSGENLLRAVTFKTILDSLCRQVGASFWVGPEAIEIVARGMAQREAGKKARLLSYDLIAPAELYRREEQVLRVEQALAQTIDLREMKGGDFALGALLTEIQRLTSSKTRAGIPVYINYDSFEPEQRATLRDIKVNLNALMDASGENLLPAVKVGTIIDQLLRELGDEAKARVAADYIEVVWTGKSEGGEAAWRPLRLTGRPRTEAMRWLDRGIEQVPESGRLYRSRGQVHLEQYELEAAITDLTRAVERNPADKQAYRLRSLAYAARGNPGDAALARADALATRP